MVLPPVASCAAPGRQPSSPALALPSSSLLPLSWGAIWMFWGDWADQINVCALFHCWKIALKYWITGMAACALCSLPRFCFCFCSFISLPLPGFFFFICLKLMFPLFLSEFFSHFNLYFRHLSLIFAFLSLLYFFPICFFSHLLFSPSKTQNALDGNGEIYLFKIHVCAEVQSKMKQSL